MRSLKVVTDNASLRYEFRVSTGRRPIKNLPIHHYAYIFTSQKSFRFEIKNTCPNSLSSALIYFLIFLFNFQSFLTPCHASIAGVLKLFVPGVHIQNFPETSKVHGLCFSALLALLNGVPRRSTGNPSTVRILDRAPPFEYPGSIIYQHQHSRTWLVAWKLSRETKPHLLLKNAF